MNPLVNLLFLLAISTLGFALQNQQPKKQNASFCGYTKEWPHYNMPDCKNTLGGSCLVDNNNCSRIPDKFTFITVLDECSCDVYKNANCTGETAQSYDGINVTDAMLFGPIRYYKCHRLKQENGSMQIREVWLASLLIGTVLVAVVLGH